MVENTSSGESPTVNRRDVLKATGSAAAGGALLVGATGSAAAWDCPDRCVEFQGSSGGSTTNITVTVSGNTVTVCSKATCPLTAYVKASTQVFTVSLPATSEEEGEVCRSVTNTSGHDISNVTVCPPDDEPGYCGNPNSPVSCDGNGGSSGSGKGKGNNGKGN